MSIYIANRPDNYSNSIYVGKRLVGAQIFVGDDTSHENGTYCASPTDSGTWECDIPLTGSNVFIYLEKDAWLNLMEMRVFGMTSLTKSA